MNETELEPGCYIDGHWGQYGPARLLQMAGEMGWKSDVLPLAEKKLHSMAMGGTEEITEDEDERIDYAVDFAEEWLNDHMAPEGLYWFWYECEFYLGDYVDE